MSGERHRALSSADLSQALCWASTGDRYLKKEGRGVSYICIGLSGIAGVVLGTNSWMVVEVEL